MSEETTPPAAPESSQLRSHPVVIGLLLIAAAGMALYLVFGPNPFTEDLEFSREVKEPIRTHAYVVKGLWLGAAFNLALIFGALTAWHFRPSKLLESPPASSPFHSHHELLRERAPLAIATLVAAALAAGLMWPRLTLSLWGDEEATTRRYLIGNVYRMDDDSFVLKAPSWKKTLFNWDQGPSNQVLFSILGRVSHGPGKISTEEPGRFHFDERRIRLPSFLAGIFAVIATSWLCAVLGFPRAGPMAAFLLALHPWLVRFGSDARGYALMMALAPLAVGFLARAFQRPHQFRWWIAFGLSQFLLFYSHLSSLYLLIPLNLAGLWLAWAPFQNGFRNPVKVANVWRFAGSTLFGAILTLQLLLPNALQMPDYFKTGRYHGEITIPWTHDWLSFWASGMPWHEWETGNPFSLTLPEILSSQPIPGFLWLVIISVFVILGLSAILVGRERRIWLLPLLCPAPLMVLHAWKSGNLLYPWYMVGFIPLTFVIIGAGYAWLTLRFDALRKPVAIGAQSLIAIVAIASFALTSQAQRKNVRTQSVEPLAETVRSARTIVNPFHPDIDEVITLGFVHATQLYDPAMQYARNDEEFVATIRNAESLGRPLSVNAANLEIGRPVFPRALELLNNRQVFEEPEIHWGLQAPCTRYVFRYKPGGLARAGVN